MKHTEYQINVNGVSVPVSEEVFAVYEEQRKEKKNRIKRDKRNRLVSYHNLDTDEISGEEIIFDSTEDSTVEQAERALLIQKLRSSLPTLEPDEQRIIKYIFFDGFTYRDAVSKFNIPIGSLHRKVDLVLCKLRNLINS